MGTENPIAGRAVEFARKLTNNFKEPNERRFQTESKTGKRFVQYMRRRHSLPTIRNRELVTEKMKVTMSSDNALSCSSFPELDSDDLPVKYYSIAFDHPHTPVDIYWSMRVDTYRARVSLSLVMCRLVAPVPLGLNTPVGSIAGNDVKKTGWPT